MKKNTAILRYFWLYLFSAALGLGNLFFFRPRFLYEIPLYLWVLLILIGAGLLGWLLQFMVQNGSEVGLSKSMRWGFLSFLAAFWIVFALPGIFVTQISPNPFSEMVFQIKTKPLPELPDELLKRLGHDNEVALNSIWVDDQKIDPNSACQVKVQDQPGGGSSLALKMTPDSGLIECKIYPINEVIFGFENENQSYHSDFLIDNRFHFQKPPMPDENPRVVIDTWYQLKSVFPNIVRFLTAALLLFMAAFFQHWLRMKWHGWGKYLNWQLPSITWVLLGSFLVYIAFFLFPKYLMRDYIAPYPLAPTTPVLSDFNWIRQTTQATLFQGIPLAGSYYLPGSFYAFVPFAIFDFQFSFNVFTLLKIVLFVLTTFLFPILVISKKYNEIPLFFMLTGLVSFGLQFETDRGQWYSLVYVLVVLSLWLFHCYYHNRWLRFTAYALFCMAVQMKLSPAIFVFMFIRDWKDLRRNLARIYALGLVNVLLIFSTGLPNALKFISTILILSKGTGPYCWNGNHSITCLAVLAQQQSFMDLSYLGAIINLFAMVCVGILVYRSIRLRKPQHSSGLDPFLLCGFTLAALLIPGENHDYTLAVLPIILSISLVIFLSMPEFKVDNLDLMAISIFYSMTLFSYELKGGSLLTLTNCMALVFLLIYLTAVALRSTPFFKKTGSGLVPVNN